MVWLILLGGVVVGVVLLVLAGLAVLGRLARLRQAMVRAHRRAAQLQGLQESVAALQARLAEAAGQASEVTVRDRRSR
jgi:hypothetical protein